MVPSRSWFYTATVLLGLTCPGFASCPTHSLDELRWRVRCFGENQNPWPQNVWDTVWDVRAQICETQGGPNLVSVRDRHAYGFRFYDDGSWNEAKLCCFDAMEAIIWSCMDTAAGKRSAGGQLCLADDGKCLNQYQLEGIL